MVEEGVTEISVGEFETIPQILASSESLQLAFVFLIVGMVVIGIIYRKFSHWISSQKFNYTRPHFSRFVRKAVLPFFALALVSSINVYIQTTELFEAENLTEGTGELDPAEKFAKILNSINILVIGWTISHLIPIALTKRDKSILERQDYQNWYNMQGFSDDDDLFHKCFKWVPPQTTPYDMKDDEFQKYIKTKDGLKFLEKYRTAKGLTIGSYDKLVDDPTEEWKKSEKAKYEKYYKNCITGQNQSGQKLRPGVVPREIYPIDIWREQKRQSNYEPLIPSSKPPGFAKKQKEGAPKPAKQILTIGIFFATVLGVVTWWGVDLVVLATATGGMALGVGLALKETMENYFAYIMIKKDKVIKEGDRITLPSGYNGLVYKITPRVTYIRHGLNESLAIVPTKLIISQEIINFTKAFKLVPATIEVGVSYLNDPKQVEAILIKIGRRAMKEVIDGNGIHLARQKRCPYLDEHKPSCGCDKELLVDVGDPVVRFNNFNDSALDFALRVFVRDYGSQFRMKSEMRTIMYQEFKNYDIRIPWPIRTIYQGDEKREAMEIERFDKERNQVVKEHGPKETEGAAEED
ncbi:mechanosensitive ion channel [Marine Group I thaumarchaeote]|uniref:Mechanosensitive ion channel n=1 Tax=Marine Group I thaumarchaeote TaxID=2511932 RepID=A0A7K4NP76_9ARCH|nr:mechanosensitive ion channel [Marine Group I thaumarchaeote]